MRKKRFALLCEPFFVAPFEVRCFAVAISAKNKGTPFDIKSFGIPYYAYFYIPYQSLV